MATCITYFYNFSKLLFMGTVYDLLLSLRLQLDESREWRANFARGRTTLTEHCIAPFSQQSPASVKNGFLLLILRNHDDRHDKPSIMLDKTSIMVYLDVEGKVPWDYTGSIIVFFQQFAIQDQSQFCTLVIDKNTFDIFSSKAPHKIRLHRTMCP